MAKGTTLIDRALPFLDANVKSQYDNIPGPITMTIVGKTNGFNVLDNEGIAYQKRTGRFITHVISIANPKVTKATDAQQNDVTAIMNAVISAIGKYRANTNAKLNGVPTVPFGTSYNVQLLDDTNHYYNTNEKRYYYTQEIITGTLADGQDVRVQVKTSTAPKRYLYLIGIALQDFNNIKYANVANNSLGDFAGNADVSNAKPFNNAVTMAPNTIDSNDGSTNPTMPTGSYNAPTNPAMPGNYNAPVNPAMTGNYNAPANPGMTNPAMPTGNYNAPANPAMANPGMPVNPNGNAPMNSQANDPTASISDDDLPF